MNIFNSLLICFISGLSTMIGALCIFITKFNKKYLCLSLTFSMIIMIGISIFDLIPNAYPLIYDKYKWFSLIVIAILLIVSYIIIKIITSITSVEKGGLYKLGVISMIILILHNIPEGIITFLTSYINYKIGIKLALAIALHNIPEGIAIAMPIYYATNSKAKALSKVLIAALSEPFGAIIAYLILSKYINSYSLSILLIIVAGLMIGLSIEDIVPEINNNYHKKSIIIGIILGIIVIIIGIFIS